MSVIINSIGMPNRMFCSLISQVGNYHIETIPLIFRASLLTGFYVIGTPLRKS